MEIGHQQQRRSQSKEKAVETAARAETRCIESTAEEKQIKYRKDVISSKDILRRASLDC